MDHPGGGEVVAGGGEVVERWPVWRWTALRYVAVWRQLLFPIDDNYISLWTTTTLLAKQRWLPKLVLTGAEGKALQGCKLSADSGARPRFGVGLTCPGRPPGMAVRR